MQYPTKNAINEWAGFEPRLFVSLSVELLLPSWPWMSQVFPKILA